MQCSSALPLLYTYTYVRMYQHHHRGIYLQIILLLGDGDCYTEAQCDAIVMCGNNHWIITPNLARSIQIDLWPGGPKSYLWQPVIASPVIERTVTLTTAGLYLC